MCKNTKLCISLIGIIADSAEINRDYMVWVYNVEIIIFFVYTLALLRASKLNKLLNREQIEIIEEEKEKSEQLS